MVDIKIDANPDQLNQIIPNQNSEIIEAFGH